MQVRGTFAPRVWPRRFGAGATETRPLLSRSRMQMRLSGRTLRCTRSAVDDYRTGWAQLESSRWPQVVRAQGQAKRTASFPAREGWRAHYIAGLPQTASLVWPIFLHRSCAAPANHDIYSP